ncbi:MAG: phosphatase PAP2 family protein [Kouleothrix sp.]
MKKTKIAPQPGSPAQAHRLLPLGCFGTYLLRAVIFCTIATIGFGWLAKNIFANRFVAFDNSTILWLHGYWTPATSQLMLLLTTMGDPVVLVPLLGVVACFLLACGRWLDAAGLLLAGGGSGLLNLLLKEIFQRVRPSLIDGPLHLTSYSFPSGHSMGAIACYGMLAYIGIRLLRNIRTRTALGLAATILIVSIGVSRVYFGVHYPTDVLGGFLAGLIWLVFSIGVTQAAEWHARRIQQASSAPYSVPAP